MGRYCGRRKGWRDETARDEHVKRAGVSLVDYSNWFNFDTCNGMELEKVLKLVMFSTLSHHFELKIHTT